MYHDFLTEQKQQGVCVEEPQEELDVYDLAALAYLYRRMRETEVISEAHHIVVDEAQDFGVMVYAVLKECVRSCTYTVMGDVSQNIRMDYGISDWEGVKNILLTGERDNFCVLRKSYRNTVEIANLHRTSWRTESSRGMGQSRSSGMAKRLASDRQQEGICTGKQQKSAKDGRQRALTRSR